MDEQGAPADPSPEGQDPEEALLRAHELVIRGGEVAPGEAQRLLAWAESVEHPLRRLPLHLTSCEAGLHRWLPQPGAAALVGDRPSPLAAEPAPLADLCRGVGEEREIDVALVSAPFHDWVEGSNGEVSARRRARGDGFAAEEGAPLPRLAPDRGGRPVPASVACGLLVSAGTFGGAYTDGLGGPHARLAMWDAVAGLLARAGDPVVDLAAAAQEASWIALETGGDWFCDVAWDLWLLVETDDAVAFVAATDSD